jgi:hypothetical protein
LNSDLNFRVLCCILFNDLDAISGVFPMLSDVLGTSSVLVVVELIINVVRCRVLSHESDVIWDVNFFGEVLNVKTAVDNLSIFLTSFIIRDQE